MGHLARDSQNRGTRDDSGINLKRAFGFVGMTGDRDVSLPVLTTRNRAILRFQHVPRARRILAESFGLCGTVPFPLVSSACVVKCKTRLFCWDLNGHSQFHLLLQRSNAHLGRC